MAQAARKAAEIQCGGIIRNLNKRGMNGYFCQTIREAQEQVLSLIPHGAKVSWGGSVTLDEIEVKDKIAVLGASVLDPMAYTDPAEGKAARVAALSADVFLTGTNAITLAGELVNIDGRGNRVAALCFGPEKVIVVCGVNKIARDVEAAEARIKTNASPANCIRLGKETPCAKTGNCADCLIMGETICSMTLVTRFCGDPDRIHVILVNETLGF